jgi:hypothetical protein
MGLLASLFGFVIWASPVHADAQIAVATFEDTRPEQPGSTVTRSLRVSNLGEQQLRLRIAPRGVDLLDDGQTHIRDGEDPRWSGLIQISEPELDLAPHGHRDVELKISLPRAIAPDEYILGVVVSSLPLGDGTRVINEIGALLPLSIAGDRIRSLEIIDHTLPQFIIGDSVTGSIRVRNPGTTLVSGWVEADVLDAFSGEHRDQVQVLTRSRVAPGTTREFTYTWQAGITAGKFRVPARIGFNRDNTTTAQLGVQEEVWLIHPVIIALAVALVALALLLVWNWRRRRARSAPPAIARPRVRPQALRVQPRRN